MCAFVYKYGFCLLLDVLKYTRIPARVQTKRQWDLKMFSGLVVGKRGRYHADPHLAQHWMLKVGGLYMRQATGKRSMPNVSGMGVFLRTRLPCWAGWKGCMAMLPLGSIKTHSHSNPIFPTLKSSKNKKFMSFGKPLKFPAICAQPRPCSTNTLEIRAVWRH